VAHAVDLASLQLQALHKKKKQEHKSESDCSGESDKLSSKCEVDEWN
jgi:hypothetical protein